MSRTVGHDARRGLAHGALAYGLWGIVAIYWKQLDGVSPVEIIAHRVVWGAAVFTMLAWRAGVLPDVRAALADRKTACVIGLSGVLLVVNWGTFIGAVSTGQLVDASLGYFLTPLVSVALGTLVLRERPRRLSWIAIGLATVGVAIRTWGVGHVPWISIVLATTFGAYGLVRKVVRIGSLAGSTLETLLVAPLAVAYLVTLAASGGGHLGRAPLGQQLLLLSTGAVTALPLLLFISAARRLPLLTLGFLQYMSPIEQLVVALAVYGGSLAGGQLVAFGFIVAGLAVFSIDLVLQSRAQRAQPNRPVM